MISFIAIENSNWSILPSLFISAKALQKTIGKTNWNLSLAIFSRSKTLRSQIQHFTWMKLSYCTRLFTYLASYCLFWLAIDLQKIFSGCADTRCFQEEMVVKLSLLHTRHMFCYWAITSPQIFCLNHDAYKILQSRSNVIE